MAKKHLNKRLLAILLLLVLGIMVVGVITVIHYKFRDPEPLLEAGFALAAEAERLDEEIDAEVQSRTDLDIVEQHELREKLKKDKSKEVWSEAKQSLRDAYRFARSNRELKVKAANRLAEICWQTKDYGGARSVWNKLFEQDRTNYQAKLKYADYYYTLCKGGADAWAEVRSQADELIAVNEEQQIGDPYAYVMKARALTQLILSRAEKDPEAAAEEIDQLLTKALELDEKNLEVYSLRSLLARMKALEKIESLEDYEELFELAADPLREGIAKNPDNPEAYLNLCNGYLIWKVQQKYQRAERAIGLDRQRLMDQANAALADSLSELESAGKRFPDNGEFAAARARLVSMVSSQSGRDKISSAIALFEEAVAAENAKANWYYELGSLYYQRTQRIDPDNADLEKAFKNLRRSLYDPEMMDTEGPDQVRVARMRYGIMIPLMVDICISLAEQSEDEQERDRYLQIGSESSQELNERLGASNLLAKTAAGALALAHGNRDQGLKLLYEVNREQDQAGIKDGRAKVKLFYALRNTSYHILAVEYASEAIRMGLGTSRLLLDYAQAMFGVPGRRSLEGVLTLLDSYESHTNASGLEKQKILIIRARALVALARLTEAQEVVGQLSGDDLEVQLLQAQVLADEEMRTAALMKIAVSHLDNERIMMSIIGYYIRGGQEDPTKYDRAKSLVGKALESNPSSMALQEIALILEEPDPGKITVDRNAELKLQVLKKISDDFDRASAIGNLYLQWLPDGPGAQQSEEFQDRLDLAAEQFKQALSVRPNDQDTWRNLLRVALAKSDWANAEQLVAKISQKDALAGLDAQADLNLAQGRWLEAADRLERILAERPLSTNRRMDLAQVYAQLGRMDEAITEVRETLSAARNNTNAQSLLVKLLHRQNMSTGIDSLTGQQIAEMVSYIDAVNQKLPNDETMKRFAVMYYPLMEAQLFERLNDASLNLTDVQKQELIRQVDMFYNSTILICRQLIENDPNNAQNWRMLVQVEQGHIGRIEDESGVEQAEQELAKIYQEAIAAHPHSVELGVDYANYLRSRGQADESELVLRNMVEQGTGPEKDKAELRLGQFYFQQGDRSQSRSVFENVVKRSPDNREAKTALAEVLVVEKDYAGALELYESIRALQDGAKVTARTAEILMNAGQLEEAEKLLNEIGQKYPNYAGLGMLRLTLEMRRGKYAAAVGYADEMLAQYPKYHPARLGKAEALYYDGQLGRALETVTELRGMVAQESTLGRALLAQVYWELTRYEDSLRELEAALRSDPRDLKARESLIRKLGRLKRWDELSKLYSQTVELYPRVVDWYLRGGQMRLTRALEQREQGNYDMMAKYHNEALEWIGKGWRVSQQTGQLDNQVRAVTELAELLNQVGRYQDTVELALQNMTGRPSDARLLLAKATALYRLGRQEAALEAFEAALGTASNQLDMGNMILSRLGSVGSQETLTAWAEKQKSERPDWPGGDLAQAVVLGSQGKPAEAAEAFVRAQSKSEVELAEQIERILAGSYSRSGQMDKAILSYQKILGRRPRDAGVLNNLAYILLEQKQQSGEALAMAEKAYSLAGNNPAIMDTYALALLVQKDYGRAYEIMRRAMQETQRQDLEIDPAFYLHLARALSGLGRAAEADEALAKSLLLLEGKNSSEAEFLREKIKQYQQVPGKQ